MINRRYESRVAYVPGLLVWLLLSVACNKNPTDTLAKNQTDGVDGTSQKASEEPDGTECLDYTVRLCEIVGVDTPTCESLQDTLPLLPLAACAAGLDDLEYTKNMHVETRNTCVELTERLCADLGVDTDSCAMVRARIREFSANNCKEMIAHYEGILDDLKEREEANRPLSMEQQRRIAEDATGFFGPEDASVVLVAFSDFECPYCSDAAKAVTAVREAFGDKVRFVFRHFPLSFHPNAHLAAQAAMAAAAQGKFIEYHDVLFENQDALLREDLERYAKQIGLKMRKFKRALDEESFKQAVDDDIRLANEISVRGTPTMILNGRRLENAVEIPQVLTEVSAEIDAAAAVRIRQ